VKYHVPDMSCGHCKASIEKAIETLDPAASIAVDLEAKTIDVSTGKPSTAVLATLADIGFPALPA
jgi:copper chaperone